MTVELTEATPLGLYCDLTNCFLPAVMLVYVEKTPYHVCSTCFKHKIESEEWQIKTKRRRSEKAVNRTIDKVDALNDRLSTQTPMLPDAVVSSPHYQKVRECLNHRAASGYVNGFWMGFTIGSQT